MMTSDSKRPESLVDLAEVLCEQNDFDEVLRIVAHTATALFNAESASLMMINPQTRNTVKTVMREGREGIDRRYHTVQIHVSGWVSKNQKPFASTDLKTDLRFTKNLFKGIPIQAVLAVPLRLEGIVFGTIVLCNIDLQQAVSLQLSANNSRQLERAFEPASESLPLEQPLSDLKKFAAISAPFLRNVQKVQQYFAAPIPEATLLTKYEALGLIGKSKKFIDLLQGIEAAARCDVRVLLEGASGTGKELIARAIHRLSSRSDHPFVAIDCGAIPANLIESELFGHVKGAFTGATTDHKGLFEEADHGTLFMDEIANLPLDMQSKLMRVLQEGEVRPLGSNKTRRVNVRIIAASSVSLRKLVDDQKFREDLFYRLHVYPIPVPALDERQEDIPLLGMHFLKKFAAPQGKQAESLHEEILEFLQQRHWAGNIRELENLVERLVTLAPLNMTILDRSLFPSDLAKEMKKFAVSQEDAGAIKPLNESLAEYEEQMIRQALIAHNWNIAKTARVLRIAEQTLRYKMGKLGIVRSKA